ncbi:glycosyltransferase family 4 protein [Niallia alba]|uniref:Glycosyltransferase family 4 protein n=1 Tax=Niallia alba TaxID=2729105 RepID=A0A7Y0PQI4_9BACI|nr:glycosyltransferase family 4 protein [Niallia alba]NMO79579.1 glycosyltransferase family 4 protein [Niallia alba]
MRILHLAEYAKGGIATYLNQIIPYQQERYGKKNVYLAISDLNSEEFNYIPQSNIVRYQYKRNISNLSELRRKMKDITEIIKPDIVHLHSTFAGAAFRIGKRKGDWKIVYTPHGWSFNQETSTWKKNIYAIVERMLTKNTDIITDISNFEMNKAIERNIDSNKLVLIYNGLNSNTIIRNATNLKVNNNQINLLFVGRFDKQKGLDLLIKFFSNYKNNSIALYIIGESVLSNKEELVLPDNVHLIGKVENSKLDEYICKMDALIIPSRWEGFGLVAVEAMRNKKPCIVSNRGALPEIVLNNYNGYVFDLDRMNSLEEILGDLEKKELRKMGENGYQRFLQLFTSKKMNHSLEELYQRVLES